MLTLILDLNAAIGVSVFLPNVNTSINVIVNPDIWCEQTLTEAQLHQTRNVLICFPFLVEPRQ